MKILILGPARSGKDTVAEYLKSKHNITFSSSSAVANKLFMFDKLKDKYGYSSPEECFEDRVNHRAEWKEMIGDYNKEDESKLTKEILKHSDIYIGMRRFQEFQASKHLFDLIVWVGGRGGEDKSSFDFDMQMAKPHILLNNNSSLESLYAQIEDKIMLVYRLSKRFKELPVDYICREAKALYSLYKAKYETLEALSQEALISGKIKDKKVRDIIIGMGMFCPHCEQVKYPCKEHNKEVYQEIKKAEVLDLVKMEIDLIPLLEKSDKLSFEEKEQIKKEALASVEKYKEDIVRIYS